MARALELVLARLPVGRAAEVRAARVDHKQAIGSSCDPDAILLLPFGVDADRVIVRRADAKYAGRFENGPRQEKPDEHQKEGGERTSDGRPDDAASHFVYRGIRG